MKSRPQLRMFFRILIRASLVRRGSTLTALLATVVATTVVTAMLNLYVDVGSKLQREFRAYGANLIVTGKDGEALPGGTLEKVDRILGGEGVAVPFAYAIAHTATGSPIVVAGTDLERAGRVNTWWSVSKWPASANTALVGSRALPVLSPKGTPFSLTFRDRTVSLVPAGSLRTGAEEDSRVYLSLGDFQTWTGVPASTIEVAASGSAVDVERVRQKLSAALPGLTLKPVRQIMEAEARVLGKTRASLLAAAVLIVTTAALCVLATLMAWVMDQRKNVAVMKALGASDGLVRTLFAAHAALLGALGAILGYGLGVGVAAWIGQANFHAVVMPRPVVFPPVFVGSVLLALLAAAVPVWLLRKVQPASILRGE